MHTYYSKHLDSDNPPRECTATSGLWATMGSRDYKCQRCLHPNAVSKYFADIPSTVYHRFCVARPPVLARRPTLSVHAVLSSAILLALNLAAMWAVAIQRLAVSRVHAVAAARVYRFHRVDVCPMVARFDPYDSRYLTCK